VGEKISVKKLFKLNTEVIIIIQTDFSTQNVNSKKSTISGHIIVWTPLTSDEEENSVKCKGEGHAMDGLWYAMD
jgi:hypothetical protein